MSTHVLIGVGRDGIEPLARNEQRVYGPPTAQPSVHTPLDCRDATRPVAPKTTKARSRVRPGFQKDPILFGILVADLGRGQIAAAITEDIHRRRIRAIGPGIRGRVGRAVVMPEVHDVGKVSWKWVDRQG